MIKPGDLAFVKTTGEQVFVLDLINDPQPAAERPDHLKNFSGVYAECRVPKVTRDGITHTNHSFLIEELETAEGRFNREYEEMFEMQNKARKKRAEDTLGEKPALFPLDPIN